MGWGGEPLWIARGTAPPDARGYARGVSDLDLDPALSSLVAQLWATPERDPIGIERVLPTGCAHLVFRTHPVQLRGRPSPGAAVLGGPRTRFHDRISDRRACSVGVVLRPGGLWRLGIDGSRLAGRHVPLSEIPWGAAIAAEIRRSSDPAGTLQAALLSRLGAHASHPAVAPSLERLERAVPVGRVVAHSGLSHRRFVQIFRREVGLSPKAYSQLVRLQRVLAQIRRGVPLADAAFATGYADQGHMSRAFLRFSGISPGRYLRIGGAHSHHLRVNFVQEPSEARR